MAGVCCSPGFLRQIEKPKDTEAIDSLKKMVQLLGRTEIGQLISQIECVWQHEHESAFGVEGAHSNIEISNSEFGRLLIENLSTNCGENNVSKAFFLNRLKRETQNVLSDVLKEEGNMRWVAGGLSVVAYIIEELKNRNNFGNEYRHSLLYMLGLLKHMKQQIAWELPTDKRDAVVRFIVVGCLVFAIPLKTKNPFGCGSQLNVADVKNLELQLGSTHEDLAFGIIKKSIQPHTQHINEVGIKEAQELVIQLLDVQSGDKSRRAIVIEGPDGIGKTKFTNATFSRLKLKRYKVARLDIDHDVSEPDMKILQQQILRDLFCKDIILKSCVEGRARLSNAFREEACRPIFIFIDTAHCKFDLGKLLPEDEQLLPIQSRILITTTDRTKCLRWS
ncbi:hypothetical protein SUGI_0723390 [Cryptomeria japonica]|uniref:uncharacterized protein LOC131057762 n=1 Tax=Cryptomeria japonica TaxID=3369 RepID=UPI00241473BE|nr:uncharacterized protein LOC131057762 [Cryptomeria japonica]GLJ36052.1 hypothetical protein SUGI_0723390 [Cryptomeria japonica]